jgi:HD superfamily phosphohydrolase
MTKPKFFRDPLHLQIRFDAVDIHQHVPPVAGDERISWLLRRLIDSEPFQRLRHIRQNGLANMVFHGAEHSRFSHSMGVSYLAREMFEKLSKNSSIPEDFDRKLLVSTASLIHDVGHGPFSHTMEEILKDNGIPFDHEDMTSRFILDPESPLFKILTDVDADLPSKINMFFAKTTRDVPDDWIYKIVSSQMDADRLDYVQRDALFAGVRGHGFDMERLFDLIFVRQNQFIAVDRGAIEALEAYLVTLDQMWRAIYYHHAVRAASKMLTSLFSRAYKLFISGDETVFPPFNGGIHPIAELFKQGEKLPLRSYLRLNDSTAWSLIDMWRDHPDKVLSLLSNRLLKRRLLKTIQIDASDFKRTNAMLEQARELTRKLMPDVPEADEYFVMYDDSKRTSYKTYNWKPDAPNESIWLTGGGRDDRPIEADDESGIISALRNVRRFDRLVVLQEVREKLLDV